MNPYAQSFAEIGLLSSSTTFVFMKNGRSPWNLRIKSKVSIVYSANGGASSFKRLRQMLLKWWACPDTRETFTM